MLNDDDTHDVRDKFFASENLAACLLSKRPELAKYNFADFPLKE